MRPWQLIDSGAIPDGGRLQLHRRGEEYSILVVGEGELMSTRKHGSEEALAQLACQRLADKASARVLVGGLGMGFTLAAALQQLGPDAEVVVAELVPAVVAWNRQYLGHYAGKPLEDPRTTVHQGDVAQLLRQPGSGFDAIMLDVDNGPEGLTRRDNNWLYTAAGLTATRAALRPGGVLAVWSASPDRQFSERLSRCGFSTETHQVRAHGGGKRGARHTIWLAYTSHQC